MLRVIVWCLPVDEEEKYRTLHQVIVEIAARIGETLGVKDENDMLCLFPRDLMEYGLGNEIFVEARGRCLEEKVEEVVGDSLARLWGEEVKELYPDARVEVEVPNKSGTSYWSSKDKK